MHSASFGVRVSAVIATRANRSGEICFGSARANCSFIAGEAISVLMSFICDFWFSVSIVVRLRSVVSCALLRSATVFNFALNEVRRLSVLMPEAVA